MPTGISHLQCAHDGSKTDRDCLGHIFRSIEHTATYKQSINAAEIRDAWPMIILHISLNNGIPYLWGEQNEKAPQKSAKRLTNALYYKYDSDSKGLRKALEQINSDIKISKRDTAPVVLWLLSRGKTPCPSTHLLDNAPSRKTKAPIQLLPYNVTARRLHIEELAQLIDIAASKNIQGSGTLFGDSLLWCGELQKLALNITASGGFLPGIVQRNSRWESRWMAFPDAAQETMLERLSLTMPTLCRCLDHSVQEMPDISPRETSDHLLAHYVDYIVRKANRSAIANPPGTSRRYDNLHDAWLTALTLDKAVIPWKDQSEIEEFVVQLEQWQSIAERFSNSAFKFCVRLNEPPETEDQNGASRWMVEYLLQPKADPSLLLPIGDLWKPGILAAAKLAKHNESITEFLLVMLGQAAGLCPAIAESLEHKYPGGFSLDTEGALYFLEHYAQALHSAGFKVILPSWWVGNKSAKRLGLKIKTSNPQMRSQNGLSLDSMLEFDYRISLGDTELSLEELKHLAGLKASLVKVRGEWTQIDLTQLQTALKFLKNHNQDPLSARELLHLSLGASKAVNGLTINSIETNGWMDKLLKELTGGQTFEQINPPKTFHGKLRPYQERGYSWLSFLRRWGLGACLADDMGLGKTVQTLALIQQEQEAGEKRPVLLICPTSVVNNWRKEAEQFTPNLKVLIHHGSARRKEAAFLRAAAEHAIVVSSYGLLQRDIDSLKKVEWAGIVLDEAQNIKNPVTKQSKAARTIRAEYRVALTGTPVENHVGDLWALMDFLNPGLLGSQTAFRQNFHRPIQLWQDKEKATRLKALTTPFILRRLKTDRSIITDLPEKMEMKEFCVLTREQASLYKAILNDMEEKIQDSDGIERRGLVLATLLKLKQICNHPAHFLADNSELDGRSGKLTRLKEMLSEIREMGERTLIFTQFYEMGALMQQYFQLQFGEAVFFLHGKVSKKRRDEMIEHFQNAKQAPGLFILSLKAGGTGITLTRANHVIHYDRWWNPAVENQATDRAFRIGQTRNVQVHKFIVAGTLEERIDKMIEKKTGIAGQVIGTGEKWLTELSDTELHKLIQLEKEAIGD